MNFTEESDDDFGRKVSPSPVKKKQDLKKQYEPRMTGIVEETEPESSFKESKEKFSLKEAKPVPKSKKEKIPHPIPEEEHSLHEEDREEDFSMDEDIESDPNPLRDFTFIGDKKEKV
jgi:hypothetical protein